MKTLPFLLWMCFTFFFSAVKAQSFLFSPPVIERELSLNAYSIDQIDITPLYPNDTAFLSYRLIENTCPNDWEFILCDWSDCFTNMPNTDDMHPLPNGYDALVKISANPLTTEGSGYLHFWIFPTGNMDAHESIYFYYNTPNFTNIRSIEIKSRYVRTNNFIHLYEAPIGNWSLYNFYGQIILEGINKNMDFKIEIPSLKNQPLILLWKDKGEMLKIGL